MSRLLIACVLALLSAASATAADLPPGAIARLGDDRFRAGSEITDLAISPDGKLFATIRGLEWSYAALTLWDAQTGRPIREHKINREMMGGGLFRGIVWNEDGGHAVFFRAEPGVGEKAPKVFPNDFRVWRFTDPKAEPPPVLRVAIGLAGRSSPAGAIAAEEPENSPVLTDFQFSGDGRWVAVAQRSADSKKHMVYVFELKPADTAAKLKCAGTIDLGAEGADSVRISADGKKLVTFRSLKAASPEARPEESVATVWDVAGGTPEKPVRVPHQSHPLITPDARELVVSVTTKEDGGFDLIDLATGKRRKLIRWLRSVREIGTGGFFHPPVHAFSPSNRVLIDGNDRKIAVVDLTTGKELALLTGHADAASAVAVSADGARIATAGSGLVRLWDAKTLRSINEAPGHRSAVEGARLSPDGKRLLTWARDGTVRLWDLATGDNLRTFTDASDIAAEGPLAEDEGWGDEPTFTPDGTAVLYCTKKRLIARDLQTGLEVPLPGAMAKLGPRGAVFSPDGKAVLTWANPNSEKDKIEVWDWPSGKKRFAWDAGAVSSPRFSADSASVFEDAQSPNRRDAKTGKELPPARAASDSYYQLQSLRPQPRLLVRCTDPEGEVIDADTGKRVLRLRRGSYRTWPSAFWNIALSPSGAAFARASEEPPDVVNLYESATGEIWRTLSGHRGEARVLGFTPDGTKLLTAGGDHTVIVWDMRLAHVPLPEAIKKETDAAKLWATLATGKADAAYLAMARLAREPDTATKLLKMKLKPAGKGGKDTDAAKLTDARAIELLEALDTDDSRALLKELAGGHADAFRTQEAKRAMERLAEVKRQRNGK